MLISLCSTCKHLTEQVEGGAVSFIFYLSNILMYINVYICDVHMYIQEHDAPVTDPVGEA
jgi:hypothetical protein